MAAILNSRAKFYQNGSRESYDIDYHIESEADIFIKELSVRQRETNITLEGQLSQRKEFKSSHSYQPVTELTSGPVPYEDFKKLSSETDSHSHNESLQDEILGNLSKRNVSRHVKELALSVKPNSVETKLLKFAISCRTIGEVQTDNRPADHPINQLDDIHNELFGHHSLNDSQKTAKTILRKRKQLLEAASEPVEIRKENEKIKPRSLWDVRESDLVHRAFSKPKLYTCKKQKLFTIRDGEIIEITKENESAESVERVTANNSLQPAASHNVEAGPRLGINEIKKNHKFQNYDKGKPSQVLYVKNLSVNVTEPDLISLFANYQHIDKPRITYNLMKKGKMRGQAFINFHCVETASRALDEINGTILHGKPVIIQFSSRNG